MTIEEVLRTIDNLIVAGETNMVTPDQIWQGIENLARNNALKIIGKGTNRIVVEINGNLFQYTGSNDPCVIKIPYAVGKGINDNNRELLLYEYLVDKLKRINNDPDLEFLVSSLPWVTRVQGFRSIIAQRKIIRIEDYVIQQQGNVYNAPDDSRLTGDCTRIILTKYKASYLRLMQALDKYTVFADLNPLVTPFQYGFMVNGAGQYMLSILDTGYVIPKFLALEYLYRDQSVKNMRYLIPGRDINVDYVNENGQYNVNIYPNDPIITKTIWIHMFPKIIGSEGLYIDVNGTSNMEPRHLLMSDIEYFRTVFGKLKDMARRMPANTNDDLAYYFRFMTGMKDHL